jgi:hypothetical protein
LDARLTTLILKNIIAAKSKEVRTGQSTLPESSKEGCGLKTGVLPTTAMMMMMMMMMMMIRKYVFRCS